jgi:hypothetical protein
VVSIIKGTRHGSPDDFGGDVAVAVTDEVDLEYEAKYHDEEPDGQPAPNVGDGRRVVHDAVHRIADPVVVEGLHGESRKTLEEAGPETVGEALAEPDVYEDVERPQDSLGIAV